MLNINDTIYLSNYGNNVFVVTRNVCNLNLFTFQAALYALTEYMAAQEVRGSHFEQALKAVPPSLTHDSLRQYAAYQPHRQRATAES